ncbi:AMP-binding protein [Massilia sp. GCM10023247]|uniref:AMP-binding protein n=1 Tax=Massilia sp. GCM10023247 TaxID=3252643 RepID=UPI003623C001
MAQLSHELVEEAAAHTPAAIALRHGAQRTSYAALAAAGAAAAAAFAAALRACGAGGGERVALRLPDGPAFVAALLGASGAGCAVVPIDPALGGERCGALLRDCRAVILVAGAGDLASLAPVLADCPRLRLLIVQDGPARSDIPGPGLLRTLGWDAFLAGAGGESATAPAAGLAALLYCADYRTVGAGDRGPVGGMALSHRNLVAGAQSTVRCAGMEAGQALLVALPLHSDHGLNALLAAFAAGATVVLEPSAASAGQPGAAALARRLGRGSIEGLVASPALLAALAGQDLRHAAGGLRYLVCAGGAPERSALDALRRALPRTRIHLLYDIGDACRSTSLMPAMLDERPGSMGRALPYSEWRVLRPDGRDCLPGETGELARCGALVTLGYWNDPQRTAAHFRALPPTPGLARRETGYFPGLAARKDGDGFLYLLDARSDIIVTQGYRVSPREVEKIVVGTGLVTEAAAVGVAHPVLGQVIAVLATPRPGARLDSTILFGACQARLPRYMLPAMVDVRRTPLPRCGDGQIDRALLAGELAPLFAEVTP